VQEPVKEGSACKYLVKPADSIVVYCQGILVYTIAVELATISCFLQGLMVDFRPVVVLFLFHSEISAF